MALYFYEKGKDADTSYKINGRTIRCISPKKMAEMFPDGAYPVEGETFEGNRKGEDQVYLGGIPCRIALEESNNRLFHKVAGYVKLDNGSYVTLLNNRSRWISRHCLKSWKKSYK